MNIAVWGTGEFGCYIEERLRESETFHPVFFVHKEPNATHIPFHLPVLSPLELKYRYEQREIDSVLIAVRNYYNLGDIALHLHELGIFQIWIADPGTWLRKEAAKSSFLPSKLLMMV